MTNICGLSRRKLANVLGVSQRFLSQCRAGKHPLTEASRKQIEALGAYHLLISDKQGLCLANGRGARI